MPRAKRMGASAPMPDFQNPPMDPTRIQQNQTNPPDKSIYSNPITSAGYNDTSRSPNTSQVGSLPNMQLSSQNSLPISQPPTIPPPINQ